MTVREGLPGVAPEYLVGFPLMSMVAPSFVQEMVCTIGFPVTWQLIVCVLPRITLAVSGEILTVNKSKTKSYTESSHL